MSTSTVRYGSTIVLYYEPRHGFVTSTSSARMPVGVRSDDAMRRRTDEAVNEANTNNNNNNNNNTNSNFPSSGATESKSLNGTFASNDPESRIQFEKAMFRILPGDTTTEGHASHRQDGEPVKYGEMVRLVHCMRRKPLTQHLEQHAVVHKANFKVLLESKGASQLREDRWRIMPRYRLRVEGELVVDADPIVLMCSNNEAGLHVARSQEDGGDECYELSSSDKPDGFQIMLYDTDFGPNIPSDALHAGDCILLLHKEENKFLRIDHRTRRCLLEEARTGDEEVGGSGGGGGGGDYSSATGAAASASSSTSPWMLPSVQNGENGVTFANVFSPPPTLLTGDAAAASRAPVRSAASTGTLNRHSFHYRSLFIIENSDPHRGGAIHSSEGATLYRLKSLSSGKYVCVREVRPKKRSSAASAAGEQLVASPTLADTTPAGPTFAVTLTYNMDDVGTLLLLRQAGSDASSVLISGSRVFLGAPLVTGKYGYTEADSKNGVAGGGSTGGVWFAAGTPVAQSDSDSDDDDDENGSDGDKGNHEDGKSGIDAEDGEADGNAEALEQMWAGGYVRLSVGCQPTWSMRDGLQLLRMPAADYEELAAIRALLPPLQRYVREMSNGTCRPTRLTELDENLRQLRRMCFRHRSLGEEDLMDAVNEEEGLVDVAWQGKLMDQGVPALCIEVVQATLANSRVDRALLHTTETVILASEQPTGKSNAPQSRRRAEAEYALVTTRYNVLFDLIQSCFHFVLTCVQGKPTFATRLHRYINFIVDCCADIPSAMDCAKELLRNNPMLVELPQHRANLMFFLDMLKRRGRDPEVMGIVALYAQCGEESMLEAQSVIADFFSTDGFAAALLCSFSTFHSLEAAADASQRVNQRTAERGAAAVNYDDDDALRSVFGGMSSAAGWSAPVQNLFGADTAAADIAAAALRRPPTTKPRGTVEPLVAYEVEEEMNLNTLMTSAATAALSALSPRSVSTLFNSPGDTTAAASEAPSEEPASSPMRRDVYVAIPHAVFMPIRAGESIAASSQQRYRGQGVSRLGQVLATAADSEDSSGITFFPITRVREVLKDWPEIKDDFLPFVQQQLTLFAALTSGRNRKTCELVFNWIPRDVIARLMLAEALPPMLHAACVRLFTNAIIDVDGSLRVREEIRNIRYVIDVAADASLLALKRRRRERGGAFVNFLLDSDTESESDADDAKRKSAAAALSISSKKSKGKDNNSSNNSKTRSGSTEKHGKTNKRGDKSGSSGIILPNGGGSNEDDDGDMMIIPENSTRDSKSLGTLQSRTTSGVVVESTSQNDQRGKSSNNNNSNNNSKQTLKKNGPRRKRYRNPLKGCSRRHGGSDSDDGSSNSDGEMDGTASAAAALDVDGAEVQLTCPKRSRLMLGGLKFVHDYLLARQVRISESAGNAAAAASTKINTAAANGVIEEGSDEELSSVVRLTEALLNAGAFYPSEYDQLMLLIATCLDPRADAAAMVVESPYVLEAKKRGVRILHFLVDILLTIDVLSVVRNFRFQKDVPPVGQIMFTGSRTSASAKTPSKTDDPQGILHAGTLMTIAPDVKKARLQLLSEVVGVLMRLSTSESRSVRFDSIRLFCRVTNYVEELYRTSLRVQLLTSKESVGFYNQINRNAARLEEVSRRSLQRANVVWQANRALGELEAFFHEDEFGAVIEKLTMIRNVGIPLSLLVMLQRMPAPLRDPQRRTVFRIVQLLETMAQDPVIRDLLIDEVDRYAFLAVHDPNILSLFSCLLVQYAPDRMIIPEVVAQETVRCLAQPQCAATAANLLVELLTVMRARGRQVPENQRTVWRALVSDFTSIRRIQFRRSWTSRSGPELREQMLTSKEVYSSTGRLAVHLSLAKLMYLIVLDSHMIRPEEVRHEVLGMNSIDVLLEVVTDESLPVFFREAYVRLLDAFVLCDPASVPALFSHRSFSAFLNMCAMDALQCLRLSGGDVLSEDVERDLLMRDTQLLQCLPTNIMEKQIDDQLNGVEAYAAFVTGPIASCIARVCAAYKPGIARLNQRQRSALQMSLNECVDVFADLGLLSRTQQKTAKRGRRRGGQNGEEPRRGGTNSAGKKKRTPIPSGPTDTQSALTGGSKEEEGDGADAKTLRPTDNILASPTAAAAPPLPSSWPTQKENRRTAGIVEEEGEEEKEKDGEGRAVGRSNGEPSSEFDDGSSSSDPHSRGTWSELDDDGGVSDHASSSSKDPTGKNGKKKWMKGRKGKDAPKSAGGSSAPQPAAELDLNTLFGGAPKTGATGSGGLMVVVSGPQSARRDVIKVDKDGNPVNIDELPPMFHTITAAEVRRIGCFLGVAGIFSFRGSARWRDRIQSLVVSLVPVSVDPAEEFNIELAPLPTNTASTLLVPDGSGTTPVHSPTSPSMMQGGGVADFADLLLRGSGGGGGGKHPTKKSGPKSPTSGGKSSVPGTPSTQYATSGVTTTENGLQATEIVLPKDMQNGKEMQQQPVVLNEKALTTQWAAYISTQLLHSRLMEESARHIGAAGVILRFGPEGIRFFRSMATSMDRFPRTLLLQTLWIVQQIILVVPDTEEDDSELLEFPEWSADDVPFTVTSSRDARLAALAKMVVGDPGVRLLPLIMSYMSTDCHVTRYTATRCALALLDTGHRGMQESVYESLQVKGDETLLMTIRSHLMELMDDLRKYVTLVSHRTPPEEAYTSLNHLLLGTMELKAIQLLCSRQYVPFQEFLYAQPGCAVSVNLVETLGDLLRLGAATLHNQTLPFLLQLLNTVIESIQGPCLVNQELFVGYNASASLARILVRSPEGIHPSALTRVHMAALSGLLALIVGRSEVAYISSLLRSLDFSQLAGAMDRSAAVYEDQHGPIDWHTSNFSGPCSSWFRNILKYAAELQRNANISAELVDELAVGVNIVIFFRACLDMENLALSLQSNSGGVGVGGGGSAGRASEEFTDRNGKNIRTVLRHSKSFKAINLKIGTVEVVRSGVLERVYFRVLSASQRNLREQTKRDVIQFAERASDNERLQYYFITCHALMAETEFYARMRGVFGLVLTYAFHTELRYLSLILSFAINVVILVGIRAPKSIYDFHSTGGIDLTIDILGIIIIVVYALTLVQVTLWTTRARLASKWRLWGMHQEQLEANALRSDIAASHQDHYKQRDRVAELPWYRSFPQTCFYLITDGELVQNMLFLAIAILGRFQSRVWLSLLLLHVVVFSPLLSNAVGAVTSNLAPLAVIGILLVFMLFIFTTIAYYEFAFLYDPLGDRGNVYNCYDMLNCFLVHLDGVRSSGGIGDRSTQPTFYTHNGIGYWYGFFRLAYFILINLLIFNLFFGTILDGFAKLREQQRLIDVDQTRKCFICGIERNIFDRHISDGFGMHITGEHRMWSYFHFLHYLSAKSRSALTAQELYVSNLVAARELSFFPIGRSMMLEGGREGEAVEGGKNRTTTTTTTINNNNNVRRRTMEEGNGYEKDATLSVPSPTSIVAAMNGAIENQHHHNNNNNHHHSTTTVQLTELMEALLTRMQSIEEALLTRSASFPTHNKHNSSNNNNDNGNDNRE